MIDYVTIGKPGSSYCYSDQILMPSGRETGVEEFYTTSDEFQIWFMQKIENLTNHSIRTRDTVRPLFTKFYWIKSWVHAQTVCSIKGMKEIPAAKL